jgi:hypothetical protein
MTVVSATQGFRVCRAAVSATKFHEGGVVGYPCVFFAEKLIANEPSQFHFGGYSYYPLEDYWVIPAFIHDSDKDNIDFGEPVRLPQDPESVIGEGDIGASEQWDGSQGDICFLDAKKFVVTYSRNYGTRWLASGTWGLWGTGRNSFTVAWTSQEIEYQNQLIGSPVPYSDWFEAIGHNVLTVTGSNAGVVVYGFHDDFDDNHSSFARFRARGFRVNNNTTISLGPVYDVPNPYNDEIYFLPGPNFVDCVKVDENKAVFGGAYAHNPRVGGLAGLRIAYQTGYLVRIIVNPSTLSLTFGPTAIGDSSTDGSPFNEGLLTCIDTNLLAYVDWEYNGSYGGTQDYLGDDPDPRLYDSDLLWNRLHLIRVNNNGTFTVEATKRISKDAATLMPFGKDEDGSICLGLGHGHEGRGISYPSRQYIGEDDDFYDFPSFGMNVIDLLPDNSGVQSDFEPDYYQGTGDGSLNGGPWVGGTWPISWDDGATVIAIVSDYGSCTDGSCPDDNLVYAVPSGWQGIPAWMTDGTSPRRATTTASSTKYTIELRDTVYYRTGVTQISSRSRRGVPIGTDGKRCLMPGTGTGRPYVLVKPNKLSAARHYGLKGRLRNRDQS